MTTEKNRAREQALAQYESIVELLENYDKGEIEIDELEESALEVCVRSDWHSPGNDEELDEYYILLCTGGPAVRIFGELDNYKQPHNAKLQYQDWGTPWENLYTDIDEGTLLQYASTFWFGE